MFAMDYATNTKSKVKNIFNLKTVIHDITDEGFEASR